MKYIRSLMEANDVHRKQDGDHPSQHGVHHPAGKFLRHAIFGINDGIVSTLGLVAGLTGALFGNEVIVISGIVTMFVGAISMSLGTYISTKSQMEFYSMESHLLKEDVEKKPRMEIEHLKEIYKKRGFTGKELDMVVKKMMVDKTALLDVVAGEHACLHENYLENPIKATLVMFLFYLIGAVIPLSSFFFLDTGIALKLSVLSSVVLLFLVGSGKTYFTGKSWIRNGIEMVIIGLIATFVAFYIGKMLHIVIGTLFF